MTIKGLYDKVAAIDLNAKVPEIINETKNELKTAQQHQLDAGIRADGRMITPDYSPMTVFIKAQKGQPYDVVTLRDTGSFWDSIEANSTKDKIVWAAMDWKFEKLVDKYSDQIIGLNSDYLGVYTDEVFRPRIKQYIESTTGLKMK